ncbi:hypothetical protein OHB36_25150 [Streptomyces sp. NBC_00320]|uniref:hypothetical protein n=1 Tax=Streptomyces sp. NBC_00320 TaxID=2975711 RepID=UPI002252731B|nr:hypothetical protein [Streptomyces sp. NBC_00320]MCX5150015.1 hypothetical protein [Streptomyces sp. NBC_00320]
MASSHRGRLRALAAGGVLALAAGALAAAPSSAAEQHRIPGSATARPAAGPAADSVSAAALGSDRQYPSVVLPGRATEPARVAGAKPRHDVDGLSDMIPCSPLAALAPVVLGRDRVLLAKVGRIARVGRSAVVNRRCRHADFPEPAPAVDDAEGDGPVVRLDRRDRRRRPAALAAGEFGASERRLTAPGAVSGPSRGAAGRPGGGVQVRAAPLRRPGAVQP